MSGATTSSADSSAATRQQRLIVGLVVFLFFAWGFGTVLNDTLIPKLKGLYSLSYTEVMLTQFCFFLSYFVFSIPAGLLLSRIGYIRGVIVGLIVMAAGCALFYPASTTNAFGAFLLALFVIAAGMTMLQVAANPYIELLGPESTSHSRLTLAQAFNSFATFIGPIIGARLLLRGGVTLNGSRLSPAALSALRVEQTRAIAWPYLAMALVLVLLACVFWTVRESRAPAVSRQAQLRGVLALLDRPRLVFGAVAIFIYVGAEVSIGSVMTNYLMQPTVLGVVAERAGTLVSFYWGGAMVGRFIGALALRIVKPGYALATCAVGASVLATLSSFSSGQYAAFTLIAVGLCNSIMFPTIFSLATEQLGEQTPHGSGLLCMAIVGGAVVPLITGAVADGTTLATALLVPAVCYIGIVVYGVLAARGLGLDANLRRESSAVA
jgi:FHS family L-fucose permease-like MFS transporter